MFSPQNYVTKSSSPNDIYYSFTPGTTYTFNSSPSTPEDGLVSVNSSPGVVYIGNSSPDNPAHKERTCPVIRGNDGSPSKSNDGNIRCSYKYEDFQDTSDLQAYIDNFGPDEGFHDTMREYCSRPDKKSCDDCKIWSSSYPNESKYHSDDSYSDSSHHSHNYYKKKHSKSSYSEHHNSKKFHNHNNSSNGNGFLMMLLIVILIVLIVWFVIDYRRRYQGGHPLGGMGKK